MGFSLAVCTLGSRPVTCNARPLLFAAHAALERGSYIEAGCRLREAIRVWLHAECVYYDCLPTTKKRPEAPPIVLAKALKKAGELDGDLFEWIKEAIEIANKAAHCVFVRPSLVECCISMVLSMLDHSTYLLQPMAGGRA